MRVIDWPQVDDFVTTPLPTEFADGLRQLGVQVVVAT